MRNRAICGRETERYRKWMVQLVFDLLHVFWTLIEFDATTKTLSVLVLRNFYFSLGQWLARGL